jgi:DNA-binding GntR family transcriptional regulator
MALLGVYYRRRRTRPSRLKTKRAERLLREHREIRAARHGADGETAEQLGQEHIRLRNWSLTESPSYDRFELVMIEDRHD